MLLAISTLSRAGVLPSVRTPWPPEPKRLTDLGSTTTIRAAGLSAPPGILEIAELPCPVGHLTVLIERLPFHKSPGRWHFRCPACGALRGVLVQVGAAAQAQVQTLGWACRTCAGLPHSRAWPLTASQRLDNALEKATEEFRHDGEKARDWRRRRQRAAQAIAKAEAMDGQMVERVARSATLSSPGDSELHPG